MAKIKFKARTVESASCEGYRSIKKSGDLQYDLNKDSDGEFTVKFPDNLLTHN